MPEPTEQLTSTLPVQLTRAEKDALDLLAAWPLCTREQLAGLMGGVTLRRVNQGFSAPWASRVWCELTAPSTCSPTRG